MNQFRLVWEMVSIYWRGFHVLKIVSTWHSFPLTDFRARCFIILFIFKVYLWYSTSTLTVGCSRKMYGSWAISISLSLEEPNILSQSRKASKGPPLLDKRVKLNQIDLRREFNFCCCCKYPASFFYWNLIFFSMVAQHKHGYWLLSSWKIKKFHWY